MRLYTFAYVVLFALYAMVNRYDQWMRLPPAATHQWRQADGAALSAHYAAEPDFWRPAVYNLFKSGDPHTTGELPLLYWISGLLSRGAIGGPYPLRWTSLAFLFAGGWAYGYILFLATRRALLAAAGALLLLSSPVLAYYGPNFLPDAPAFCCILMMGACAAYWTNSARDWLLYAAGLFAAIAVSLKASMAILPAALVFLFGRMSRAAGASAAGAIALAAVVRYGISDYNKRHGAHYFLADIRPVWHYDQEYILETLYLMGKNLVLSYSSAGLSCACAAGLYITVKNWKATPPGIKNTLILSALGSVLYALLWFRMLREHDYYYICLLVLPALLLWNALRIAVQTYKGPHIASALALCLIGGLAHAHIVMERRRVQTFRPENNLQLPVDAFLAPHTLEKAGISPSERFFCPEDPSPNIALSALDRHGWTAYNFGDRINADTLQKYRLRFDMTHLALRDTTRYSALYQAFFPDKIWMGSGWHIYRIAQQGD